MHELITLDQVEMERRLPECATCNGRVRLKDFLCWGMNYALRLLVRLACILLACNFVQVITYSRKVFIPLTRLCRDRCSYCTFAEHDGLSGQSAQAYLSKEEVLEIAREGEKAGCTEALFTLGDRPEARWPEARDKLQEVNHSSTISYLAECCQLVLQQTSLLPHVNAGVCTEEEMAMLRKVSVSQGLMLETLAPQLLLPGAPHHRSPDKAPNRRLEMLEAAGKLKVPFTTGILIGIGESRRDRLEALAAIRASHERWGHIQETIIQPFRAKKGTAMAASADADSEELEWTIMAAVGRFPLFGARVLLTTCMSPVSLRPLTNLPALHSAGPYAVAGRHSGADTAKSVWSGGAQAPSGTGHCGLGRDQPGDAGSR